MDYLEIGPVPPEEDCEQVGTEKYDPIHARKECQAYIEALRKKLGNEPNGARLRIRSNPHDFGTYSEVAAYYDENNEQATDYAFKCESEGPMTWAEVGMEKP